MNRNVRSIFVPILFLSLCLITCKKDNPGNSGGAVGVSAHDFLSADSYNTLNIEVDYMPGFKPDDASISNLKSLLSAHINKPSGINISYKEIPAQSGRALSLNDISQIESTNRSAFNSGSTIAAYVLFTDGEYAGNSGDSKVLGIAYKSASTAVFGKTIHDNSGGVGQSSRIKLESTVIEHEFGHLLGLVDIGTPMQTNHIDAAHGKHCKNSGCLLYYASETTDVLGILVTGSIPELDADCINDLKGNGGK